MKKVSILLGVLLAVLIVLKIKENKQGERSFKEFVVMVDTSEVNRIKIHVKPENKVIDIKKTDGIWLLNWNGKQVQADQQNLYDLLSQTHKLKPKQVVATTKEKWSTYEVNDSLGSRVEMLSDNKTLADFVIGKFSYSQPKGQNPYMQQQGVTMTSYIRNYKEKEVYAVDGYLSMIFSRNAESFRDNSIVVDNPENWKELVYTYPDSSFTLVKDNNKWLINGLLADSTAVDKYFSQIRMLTSQSFDNESVINNNEKAVFKLRIERDKLKPIEVQAIKNNLGEVVYTSSENKGNIFKSEQIKNTLFVSKKRFLQNGFAYEQ